MALPSQSNDPAACWNCSRPSPERPFCKSCGKIQDLPVSLDYFGVLGLPPSLKIDEESLRQRFHDLSRKLHPDKFALSPTPESFFALRWSTELNKAYQTLRDRLALAAYAVETFGEATLKNSSAKVPLELAEEYFELQDLLSESGKIAELTLFRQSLEQKRKALDGAWSVLTLLFAAPGTRPQAIPQLKDWLDQHRYLSAMLRDLDAKLEAMHGDRRN